MHHDLAYAGAERDYKDDKNVCTKTEAQGRLETNKREHKTHELSGSYFVTHSPLVTLPSELPQSRILVSPSVQTIREKDSAATSFTEESPIVRQWSEGRLDLDNYCQAVSDSLQTNEKAALLSEKLLEAQYRHTELSYQQKTVHKEQLDQSILLTDGQ